MNYGDKEEKYLLDPKKSIVLGNTLATGGCTSLDLASSQCNNEVSDHGVLGLTRTMGDHDTPTVGLRELGTVKVIITSAHYASKTEGGIWHARLDRLRDGSDLVNLWTMKSETRNDP